MSCHVLLKKMPIIALCLAGLLPGVTGAADWPMWRYDANRCAASPQALAPSLQLQWVREYPPLKPAWPDQPRMQFDSVYEPVVMGHTLFVGSPRTDSLAALDTRTGVENWHFYADAPIRLAPVAWEGKVYFASDDGYLYCVDADTGKLRWKFRGGPSDRKVLGNDRLISTWPARGGPVIAEGTIYFAASIWPFMGIFIHALDARTGQVVWTNDGDGSLYIKQPHNADSFAGVAPQGPLVVAGDVLLIPGGRSVPACYDRKTGKLLRFQLGENGKRGGWDVAALKDVFCNGGSAYEIATERYLGEVGRHVVLTDDVLYSYASGSCRAHDFKNAAIKTAEVLDRRGVPTKVAKWSITAISSHLLAGVETQIKGGTRLYAGMANQVVALRLPTDDKNGGGVTWQAPVEGTPASLVAADDRLFVVTREGRIYCFGPEKTAVRVHPWQETPLPSVTAWTEKTKNVLQTTKAREGYCICLGIGSGGLIAELVRQSRLHVLVVDPDLGKVRALRDQLVAAGLYGERIAVHAADPATFPFPPYFASLIVSEDSAAPMNAKFTEEVFEWLRPHGGVACLPKAAGLANARLNQAGDFSLLVREGALPGSANWTHEHADAANTRVSKDTLKAPLGLLWFGGPSHEAILPRHGHGPQPQVIDGRLIIEGMDVLRALDIYTGRLLWETSLPGVGTFYNNTAHQPGANASGTNYISTSDSIYVAYGKDCLRLDPATGRKLTEFPLPLLAGAKEAPNWGYLNVSEHYLVGGADPLFDPAADASLRKAALLRGNNTDSDAAKPTSAAQALLAKLKPLENDNLSSSKHLVVMDRHSGKVLWTATARDGFRHNAICIGGGRLYAVDRLSGTQLGRLKRRGETPATQTRLAAFDMQTGKVLWSTEQDVFGTWLGYSSKHDVLVESGRVARDTISDEPKGMRAYRARDGAVLWHQPTYVGPAMIHGDTILKDRSACDVLTGAPKMRQDPLTGQPSEWTWSRNYGCNTPMASENLLTFRSGAAGYLDYCNDGGTGNLGGFRSSCTNNLIVAGGLLVAPEYTRTCVCSYQNQTSLALVHMPDAEMWTFFGAREGKGPIRRLGINLGAPGDRRAEDGTLWLEYPSTGGQSPTVPIRITPEKPEWFRRHSSQVEGDGLNWVAASGAKGLTSVVIGLDKEGAAEHSYTVRLHFMEPEPLRSGQRLFNVALQGQEVVKDFDVVKEAAGSNRALVKEFRGVKVGGELTVAFSPSASAPSSSSVLCGIDLHIEEP